MSDRSIESPGPFAGKRRIPLRLAGGGGDGLSSILASAGSPDFANSLCAAAALNE